MTADTNGAHKGVTLSSIFHRIILAVTRSELLTAHFFPPKRVLKWTKNKEAPKKMFLLGLVPFSSSARVFA